MEVKIVQIIFNVLTGLKSFAGNIFGNFTLSLDNGLTNTFVHKLVCFLGVILIVINGGNLRKWLVGFLFKTVGNL